MPGISSPRRRNYNSTSQDTDEIARAENETKELLKERVSAIAYDEWVIMTESEMKRRIGNMTKARLIVKLDKVLIDSKKLTFLLRKTKKEVGYEKAVSTRIQTALSELENTVPVLKTKLNDEEMKSAEKAAELHRRLSSLEKEKKSLVAQRGEARKEEAEAREYLTGLVPDLRAANARYESEKEDLKQAKRESRTLVSRSRPLNRRRRLREYWNLPSTTYWLI